MTAELTDRYTAQAGDVQMTGVQALVRLPMNVRRADRIHGRDTAVFISGYEGSPLGGYDLELQRQGQLLDDLDVVFRPGVNEELAATSVQGTQLVAGLADARVSGVTGFWYGKSPGLDRATDALRHANLMGTHPRGGALVLVGDDPSAKSSTVPGASEALLADLGMPVLFPADPQDVLDLGTHAVAMSRFCGLWVALKIVTNVADGVGKVRVDCDRIEPVLPQVTWRGERFEHRINARMLQPGLSEMEQSRDGIRLTAARTYARANKLNRIEDFGPRPTIGIVAAGKTYLDMRQALVMLGLDDAALRARGVRLLRLGMIHPLVPDEITEFAAGLDEIIVVEEKRPFVESAVKQILYGRADAPRVTGKTAPDGVAVFAADGELDADGVAAGLARRLGALPGFAPIGAGPAGRGARRTIVALPLAARTPYFCSGCPHNRSTKVPDGSLVGAGIGCHTLVLMMGPDSVGDVMGLTQMGGEGTQWIGMSPFLRTRKHLLQNIGDGTFHHSGSLAVRASVAAGTDVTYKLLYNSAVAMTGGQQAVGAMSIPALTRMLTAEGVRRIIVTTQDPGRYRGVRLAPAVEVWHRDRLVEAQEVLSRVRGVTVLIHDQECATELRRKRKRGLAPDPAERVMINERVCEGCGDCGQQSNCLSVQPVDTEFGRKTLIDQSSCNKDFSCLAGDCPSFLTVVPDLKSRAGRRRAPALPADAISEPASTFDLAAATHTTRITGVGGSGVVTLSQILTAAALTAGREVRSLDQTGLAQKGGAVVSDVRISAAPIEQSNKAAAGECDLYLGCDLLVAADARNLAVTDPDRTVAVVSTTKVPTGRMVVDSAARFPDVDATAARIKDATRAAQSVFVDARKLSVTLFGTDQFANMFLTGVALQTGCLPLPAHAIEEAIRLNGVQVEPNLQALRRGRQYVADPDAFAATVAELTSEVPARELTAAERGLVETVGAPAGSELERLVSARIPDLVGYQSLAYARRYAEFVTRVHEAERHGALGTDLSEAVARYLYKLMAYKDEYEVARLSLDPQLEAAVRAEFGGGAKVSYRLHPPVLRALGMKRKVRLGPWFRPVFAALRTMRVLRGTPLDLFGLAAVRRTERKLVEEYRGVIEGLLPGLSEKSYARCVELAALPDMVRGYEDIKLANVVSYRRRVDELTAGLPPAG
ncbi:indolepyruvate ferredoxin oxidoreductase family protein [Dactylosporangium sp. CA-233914]|uniref:indolepyruvate ferredoxin oxidoreductase family protein n=1 Tax=Dactylosporangium sp. CA-233914 TaxID=3239934 RepID=UPI003D8DC589